MAIAWANFVTAETNGYSLFSHCRQVGIKPTMPADVMDRAWEQLQRAFGCKLPPEIMAFSPPHPATLSYLCTEWATYTGADDPRDFCRQLLESKIFFEARPCFVHVRLCIE